MTDEPSNQLNI